ncbi:hypothetical protein BDW72DRAFT_94139 [Aspergillus terricola var. indicus]
MKAFGLVDLFILIQNISYLFCYLYVLELRTTFFLMSLLGSQSCRSSMQSCARLAPNSDVVRLNGTRHIVCRILRAHVKHPPLPLPSPSAAIRHILRTSLVFVNEES